MNDVFVSLMSMCVLFFDRALRASVCWCGLCCTQLVAFGAHRTSDELHLIGQRVAAPARDGGLVRILAVVQDSDVGVRVCMRVSLHTRTLDTNNQNTI